MTTASSGPGLRAATSADERGIALLLTTATLPTVGVHDALPNFVVAADGDTIVGVAGIEPCGDKGAYALLRSVAVAPAWQARGLGRALVTRAIAEADARHIKALYLLTTTAENYFPAFGFVVTDRDAVPDDIKESAEYCGACPASATVMVRPSSH